jgi:EAL domain-containing protein (putative c-di-GMP-specific phosphodiesterase class I)/CheY-like chemotaxis protein
MEPADAPQPAEPPVPAGRVLVVDDDPELLRGCVRVLQLAGLEVLGLGRARQALELCARERFDAIVTDLMMPEMTGLELIKQVRSRDLDVPMLLMTAFPTVDNAVAAIDQGVLCYLRKPFTMDTFTQAVLKAVKLHRLALLKREAIHLAGDDLRQFGDRVGLNAAFDRALTSLWIAFQPVVSWSRRRALAYEALLRTQEPLLPHPEALLRAGERLGRLHEVGRSVRALVSRQMGEAPTELVFINLHANDLLDDQLYAANGPLTPYAPRIVFEVTERASLDAVPGADARVRELRKAGYRLALDDLGAGYAGLASFAIIEPEYVKFDMSLVREVDASSVKRHLLRAMATLFKEMDITTIAEGVETDRERTTLVALGCDVLQGYLFARPAAGFPPPRW